MDGQILSSIMQIIVLIILSGYFSATETAFTSVNRIRIKNLSNEGNKRAQEVLKLTEEYDKLLSTILVGNNLVNIAMTAVATMLFIRLYGEYGATIATIVITVVVLVFGEVTPKSIAKEKAESFTMATVSVIKFIMMILTPINWVFSKWKKMLAKIFKLEENSSITEEELLTIVEEAETEGSINEEHSTLIQNAIEFEDLLAEDVLTSRVDIKAIEKSETKANIASMFADTGYSRLPVYEDDMDNVLGILNQKDFYKYINDSGYNVIDYVKPVVYAPITMKASVLLKKMQQLKTHMAIIVDEYGGTEGLVTMEDIIEELVGKIYDEHDAVENEDIVELNDGSFRVMCGANLEKVFEFFNIDADIEATTVNGWVVLELDKLPKVGNEFTTIIDDKKINVKVIKADEKKALEIKVKITDNKLEEIERGH